ncbi:MAG: electron transporter RnfC [Spirochaetes bacterium GWF1_31_7]|nr:MAG: electron transporter RnfC [Spirochaetes bacterium GWE1_32_154]OHD50934.1 MAG: electron transporter RnfC [Spirochaetes bacterium GWE2_31_10]OHD51231.1 MAG: electron transporter RnfC [Spirochaetes bacterium GWF1_31_7]OHD80978.1 MAG: electron transporter RnfC [Spirochaetes bacterium RIFOXYB1_FULL_32_8]HBD96128.1 electron transport complex subunit RsxC [Spirochaetia bacterium]
MFFSKSFGPNGVHPEDYKKLTNTKKIESADIPNIAYIPVSQHIGKPAKIIVSIGDHVEEGQIIAIGDGFISSTIHSSIPGTVIDIKDMYISNGKLSKVVVIELNGEFRKSGKNIQLSDYLSLSKEDIINKIRDAGIVGMGGATFPLYVKLTVPQGKKIDTMIINAAECEPFLSCDHRLLLEKTESFLEGILIANKVIEAKNVYIGIENNKKDAIKRVKALCENRYPFKVISLKVKYPQGDEKQLIKSVTQKVLPIGKLPSDIGIVVINTSSVIAIKEAIVNDKPLIERVVTVTGPGIKNPKNLYVKIGTPVKEIIDECGGLTGNVKKVIIGGPMMGFAQMSLDIPVTKGTSGILCLTEDESSKFEKEAVCINCGKCISSCAFGLVPTVLNKYINNHLYTKAYEEGLLNCKECGACAWSCPAKIPLVQNFRLGKNMINKIVLRK